MVVIRALCCGVLALAAATALVGVPATAAAIEVPGEATAVAADGRTVAVGLVRTFGDERCRRVAVWRPGQARAAYAPMVGQCPGGDIGGTVGLPEVAVAGERIAWLELAGGNALEQLVYTARIGDRQPVERAFASMPEGGAGGDLYGRLAGGLRGDGGLLVFETWSQCWADPPGFERPGGVCEGIVAPGDEPVLTVREQRLWSLPVGAPKRTIRRGASAHAIAGADAGRVATRGDDGAVSVVGADGALAGRIPVAAGAVRGTALSGRRFSLGRDNTIESFLEGPAGTWTAAATVALAPPPARTATLADLQGALGVVVAPGAVRVVRLTDGASSTTAAPRGARVVGAAIEPQGLFTVTVRGRGAGARTTIAFTPIAAVRAGLAGPSR